MSNPKINGYKNAGRIARLDRNRAAHALRMRDRAARSDAEQRELLLSRPGDSTREMTRLLERNER